VLGAEGQTQYQNTKQGNGLPDTVLRFRGWRRRKQEKRKFEMKKHNGTAKLVSILPRKRMSNAQLWKRGGIGKERAKLDWEAEIRGENATWGQEDDLGGVVGAIGTIEGHQTQWGDLASCIETGGGLWCKGGLKEKRLEATFSKAVKK